GDRGEREPAKHAPGTGPGKRVTGAGTRTEGTHNTCALRRQTPEVGAECPNWARSDLCGGRPAMDVPTANDYTLVTTDCRFDLRAHVIAGGLLPIHAPMLFDPRDMPVALGRRCCGSWSRHGPLAWRNDETGARVSGENGVENSASIIGAIGHK